jgi:hypothetical protein
MSAAEVEMPADAAGGGHTDPTKDPAVWTHFLDLVEEHHRRADWPAEPWGRDS